MSALKKSGLMILAVSAALVFSGAGAPLYAKPGKGKGKGKEKSQGQGKKVGWGDKDVPPGIAKQGEEKIAKWKEAKAKAKGRAEAEMKEEAKKKNKSEEEQEEEAKKAGEAVEAASNAGVPVLDAEDVVVKAIKKGITGEDIKRVADTVVDIVKGGASGQEVARKAKEAIKEKTSGLDVVKALKDWAAEKAVKIGEKAGAGEEAEAE